MTSVPGIHYGGYSVHNGPFRSLFPQATYAADDKRATVSAHKFSCTVSVNSRGILIGDDFADTCCECCVEGVTEAIPSSALVRYFMENGGWPRVDPADPTSAYAALPIVELAHAATLDKVYWNILKPLAGSTWELVLNNAEVPGQVINPCGDPSETVDAPGNELGGAAGEVILAEIDGSLSGCFGLRDGQGLADLTALGIVCPDNLLRFNDWIGIRPTVLPDPEAGQDPACVLENFAFMVSATQTHMCNGA